METGTALVLIFLTLFNYGLLYHSEGEILGELLIATLTSFFTLFLLMSYAGVVITTATALVFLAVNMFAFFTGLTHLIKRAFKEGM